MFTLVVERSVLAIHGVLNVLIGENKVNSGQGDQTAAISNRDRHFIDSNKGIFFDRMFRSFTLEAKCNEST